MRTKYSSLSPARRGSILIMVVGVASLLAVTATAVLLRVQADGRANRVVVQDAQCRLALTSALHFLLETSRIGWDADGDGKEAYGWVDIRDGQPGPRIDGQGPVGAGGTWPQLGSVYRGDMFAWQRPPYAMDINPAPAPVPWQVGSVEAADELERPIPRNDRITVTDGFWEGPHGTHRLDQNDVGGSSGRVTGIALAPRQLQDGSTITVTIFKDSGHTESIGSVSFPASDLTISSGDGEGVQEISTLMEFTDTDYFYAQITTSNPGQHRFWRPGILIKYELDYDVFDGTYNLFAEGSGPEEWQAGRERQLNRDLMADFLEREPDAEGNWTQDSRDLMAAIWNENLAVSWENVALTPRAHEDNWDDFSAGDTTPRGESLGRGWFRIYRETAAQSQADHHLPGSTFVITVGAGGTRGFRDWSEAQSSGLFPSESVFNSLRRAERLQWWRVRWVPQVGGGLDMAWHKWTSRIQNPAEYRSSAWNRQGGGSAAISAHENRLSREAHLTLMATNLDATMQTSQISPVVQQGGSIDWMYRLKEEPPTW